LQSWLDALLYEQRSGSHGAEMRPCASAVGDIDGIDKALQWQRLGQQFGTVHGHWRRHFRSYHKTPGTQLVLKSEGHLIQVAKSSGRCKGNNGKSGGGVDAAQPF
jgi:hypothetical protein